MIIKMLKQVTTPEQRTRLRQIASRTRMMLQLSMRLRYMTAPVRVLPDFIILGTQKGGTTSLFHYLTQHPDIIPPQKKELHFFDDRRTSYCGKMFYRSYFPTLFQKYFHQGKVFLTGEATPDYLFFPYVPNRAVSFLPHIKGIILLRNPVDRAYSQYLMNTRLKWESRSFEAAIAAERSKFVENPTNKDLWLAPIAYLARGLYLQQLETWFQQYPREQFLIIQSEKFFEDPNATLQDVLEFLGLSPYEFKNLKKYNEGTYSSTMSVETRERLQQFFKPYNQKLYDYLGVDYGW